jgi:hypothetical protein
MTRPPAFLFTLETAAQAADAEETAFRREPTARIETLERARTFAFRRLNVLRAMAEVARRAPDPGASLAAGLGLIRDRLGWTSVEDEARRAVLDELGPLAVCSTAAGAITSPPSRSRAAPALPNRFAYQVSKRVRSAPKSSAVPSAIPARAWWRSRSRLAPTRARGGAGGGARP